MHSTRYRPDIDGLRTLAVLPVIFYHAGVGGFGGGYVGVDIFFVISGYLITGILLNDLDRGTYSIGRFYERRIRRIFPALGVVVLTSLMAGWLVLTPVEYVDLGRSALAVVAFVSNFFFWRSVDYFGDQHAIQPLLHTWSLAVEEQFYIVFPPLLAWMVRRRVRVVPVLVTILALSFVLAAVVVLKKPSAAFYLPFTRAWELLVGALLAVVPIWASASRRARHMAGVLGLALVVLPIALYTSTTVFPGVSALPPVLGAALLIWSGSTEHGAPTSRLLGAAPMTFVGRISYSLYLWHVPVFAYLVYLLGGTLSPWGAAVAIGISFILAWLTYRLVETPFRLPAPWLRGRPATVGVAMMTMVLAAALAVMVSHGAPSRLDARGATLVDVAGDKQRFHDECMSVGDVIVEPSAACHLGTPGVAPTALLWGDSHAMVVATPMELAARRRNAAFLFAATADCPVGIGFAIDTGTEKGLTETPSYRFCARYNQAMLRIAVDNPAIRHVVLAARWTNWRIGAPANKAETPVDIRLRDETGVAATIAGNAAIFERGFKRLIANLRAAGKIVTIVGPLPEPDFNVPHRLFIEQFGIADRSGPTTMEAYRRRHRHIIAMFAGLSDTPGVKIVWPATLLCRGRDCPIENRGQPVFFDHNHLSMTAASRTAPLYLGVFD